MPSETTTNSTPNHLRRYRRQKKLRQRDIARLVGILNTGHVWQWESGKRKPSLRTALKLSAAIGCPVELLFSDEFLAIRRQVAERRNKMDEKNRA